MCSGDHVRRGSESEGLGSALDADLKQDGCRPPDGREYSTGLGSVQTQPGNPLPRPTALNWQGLLAWLP
jgi:hypothetical protein